MKNLLLTYFWPTLRISRKPTFDLLLSDFDFSAVLGPLEGNQPHNSWLSLCAEHQDIARKGTLSILANYLACPGCHTVQTTKTLSGKQSIEYGLSWLSLCAGQQDIVRQRTRQNSERPRSLLLSLGGGIQTLAWVRSWARPGPIPGPKGSRPDSPCSARLQQFPKNLLRLFLRNYLAR